MDELSESSSESSSDMDLLCAPEYGLTGEESISLSAATMTLRVGLDSDSVKPDVDKDFLPALDEDDEFEAIWEALEDDGAPGIEVPDDLLLGALEDWVAFSDAVVPDAKDD